MRRRILMLIVCGVPLIAHCCSVSAQLAGTHRKNDLVVADNGQTEAIIVVSPRLQPLSSGDKNVGRL